MWSYPLFRLARRLAVLVSIGLWASHYASLWLPWLQWDQETVEYWTLRILPFCVLGLLFGTLTPKVTLARKGTLSPAETAACYGLTGWSLLLYWPLIEQLWSSGMHPLKHSLMQYLVGATGIAVPLGVWLPIANGLAVLGLVLLPLALVSRLFVFLGFRVLGPWLRRVPS